jgi:hypothetical protein
VGSDTRAWAAALYGLLGLAVFSWEVKVALPEQRGPAFRTWALGAVDPPRPTRERAVPPLGNAGAPIEPRCRDPAPSPLPFDPNVLDPSERAEPLGVFTDVREIVTRGVPHAYGRTLRLWSVGGSLTGTLTSRAGPASEPGHLGKLDRARLDPSSGELTFDAFFDDGFFARFGGVLSDDEVRGVLVTADAECVRRVLSTDSVVLRKSNRQSN